MLAKSGNQTSGLFFSIVDRCLQRGQSEIGIAVPVFINIQADGDEKFLQVMGSIKYDLDKWNVFSVACLHLL